MEIPFIDKRLKNDKYVLDVDNELNTVSIDALSQNLNQMSIMSENTSYIELKENNDFTMIHETYEDKKIIAKTPFFSPEIIKKKKIVNDEDNDENDELDDAFMYKKEDEFYEEGDEYSVQTFRTEGRENPILTHPNIPAIPTKIKIAPLKISNISEIDKQQWFVVLSPREIKGVKGPLSVSELRDLYRYKSINDSTMMWRDGMNDWKQLMYMDSVKHEMVQHPVVPLKSKGTELFNVLPEIPKFSQSEKIQNIKSYDLRFCCGRCGSPAVGHTPGEGQQSFNFEELGVLRPAEGSRKFSSEIIPGFLWIGNSTSARNNELNQLRATLLINCTNNLKNPKPRPPYYRCKDIPLLENLNESEEKPTLEYLLETVEKVYDWLEQERLTPELGRIQEPYIKNSKAGTDQYGRPKKTNEDFPPRPMKKGVKDTPSKVLLWSRLGLERPCFLVVGYIIKRFCMNLERSLHIVKQIRAGTELSPIYMEALQEWSNMNAIGELLCIDCIDSAKEIEKKKNEKALNQEILAENYAKYKDYTKKYDGITSLGEPQTYIQRVYLGEDGERRNQEIIINPLTDRSFLTKIIDLSLNSKRLGDDNVRRIFNAIRKSGIGNHLRVINLRENGIKKDAMFSITDALAHISGGEPHELMYLDLSNNDIGHNGTSIHGSQALASLVRDSNSLTYLNVNNNNLSDEGAKAIFDVLGEPLGFTDNDEPKNQFNQSVIELHIESNSLGEISGEAIMDMLKSNKVLVSLYIDDNPNLPAKMIKHIANSLRIYNSTVQTISLSDIPLSPKSAGYLIRVLESTTFPLSKLSMCRCQMTSLHISPFAQFGKSSKFLTNLDLSCNNIGDTGAEWIAVCLKGTINRVTNIKYPPLKKLDLNCCGIELHGIQLIIEAAAESPLLKYLDLSDNEIGSKIDSFMEPLSNCYLSQFHLNRCKLTSKGTSAIFEILKFSSHNLSKFLKVLCLSSNEIMDSATGIIVECLSRNMVIEVLDLGFNQFSDLSKPEFNHMTKVSVNSKDEIRLITLNVNMIGNNCGDYSLLEVPGQTRSKMNYRFSRSTNANIELSSAPNNNYNYISALSRDHLLERKYFENRYLDSQPETKSLINFVS